MLARNTVMSTNCMGSNNVVNWEVGGGVMYGGGGYQEPRGRRGRWVGIGGEWVGTGGGWVGTGGLQAYNM